MRDRWAGVRVSTAVNLPPDVGGGHAPGLRHAAAHLGTLSTGWYPFDSVPTSGSPSTQRRPAPDDYEVLGISWDATNGRDRWVVRYRGIGNADTGHENVQDVDEFLGTVQLPSGETVPRYKFLGPDAAGERG